MQTKEEKEKYENSAKAFKELDVKVSELSDEKRKKLIERHRKKLLEYGAPFVKKNDLA